MKKTKLIFFNLNSGCQFALSHIKTLQYLLTVNTLR